MRVLNGKGSSSGVAVGDIYFLKKHDLSVVESKVDDISAELERFNNAKIEALTQLDKLYEHAVKTDFNTAQVFEVHKMLIDDPDFSNGCIDMISDGSNAEWAVFTVRSMIADMFLAMEDPYMKARSADIIDISDRLLKILKGIKETDLSLTGKLVVVAEDLLPSETVKLDKNNIVGFVTKYGSNTSHSAILARIMGIPAVVGLRESFSDIPLDGKIAIDGDTGKVIVDPTSVIIANYREMIKRQSEEKEELKKYIGKKAVTKCGHGVKIGANIGSVSDVEKVLQNDADCVGLFRSEFVYLESDHFPTEEEQFKIYKQVVEGLKPLNVIIRTLDLGADKQAPYFGIPNEENPALGYRAIRICLSEPQIFETQLRALLRASAFGSLSIMFPMISHFNQIVESKRLLKYCMEQLKKEGIAYDENISVGVMIETPASVMIADKLAKEVDFFSIGTNDLTQYTLACDRMNANVEQLFDSGNEAVLRMIELTAKSAHEHGIWVGICGESAGDLNLNDFYMSVGIDELSVSPSKILSLKKAVINCNKETVE